MRLVSSGFQDGSPLPTKYAYPGVTGGKNLSVPLEWSGVPAGAASLAVSIVDPHPVAKNWLHWLAVNIPPATTSLAEGASGRKMPAGCREIYNSYGERGYGGPEPPPGSGRHPYVMTVYALSAPSLDLTDNSSLTAFLKAIDGKILASAAITGTYER